MRKVTLPYIHLLEQNAMIGEDIRSHAMVNFNKRAVLQAEIRRLNGVIKSTHQNVVKKNNYDEKL